MKLAFVTPRYGEDVLGGAEALAMDQARGLAGRGHAVEVLTSWARDTDTWAADWPEGVEHDGDVVVRRFAAHAGPDPAARDALDRRVLGGETLSPSDQEAWIDARVRVPGLTRHIAESADAYDALVFSPYLAWTTLRGLPLAGRRGVLVACLHDEPAARQGAVRAALAGAGAVWFLSEPEHQLAHRLAPLAPHRVVGSAVAVPASHDPEGFRRRHGLSRPFVLYAGRREDGKGWPEALRGFAVAVERFGLDCDLVTIGTPGPPVVPPPLAGRVRGLGFLDVAEVGDAFAAASAYLQPSRLESFSRTLMESWLAGTPVVASAFGEVVAWHVERAGGGLLYADELELASCLRALVGAPGAAARLGEAGRRYVVERYTWPSVLDGLEEALDACCGARAGEGIGPRVRREAAGVRAALFGGEGDRASALDEWLPAPGAGVPAWATDPAPPARPVARSRALVVARRAGAVLLGRQRADRLARTVLAALCAWRSPGRGSAP